MNVADLKTFRERAGLKQVEMAELVGMSLRAYQDVETGVSGFRAVHVAAVERVSLRLAVERKDIGLALPSIRRDALDLAALIRGD